MNVRRGAVLLPLLLLFHAGPAWCAAAPRVPPLTLHAALRRVLARHPLVRAAEAEIEAARGLDVQARQWASPRLSYHYSTPTKNAALSELFEFPGKRALRAEAAELTVRQAEQQLRATRAALAFQTRQAFYHLLLMDREVANAKATLAAVDRIRRAAAARYRAGDAARLDVVKADLSRARARQALRVVRGQRRVAVISLNVLLGRPMAAPLHVQGRLTAAPAAPGLHALLQQAYAQDPALASARLEQQKRERDLALAKRQKFPNLDLSASYGIEDGVRTPGFTASIGIPLPGAYHGEVETAAGRKLAAVAGEQAAYYQVTEAVASAYEQWLADQAQVRSYQTRLLAESAQVLAGAQASYRAGETGILNVLDAERTNLQVRQAYAQALYQRQLAVAKTILARGGVQ